MPNWAQLFFADHGEHGVIREEIPYDEKTDLGNLFTAGGVEARGCLRCTSMSSLQRNARCR